MQKVISIVICFTAIAVAAQQEPSGTPQLPEVTVTSGRLPGESLPVTKTPANVTVITSDQIEQSSELSVPEILTHQVGIQNTDTVGFGIDAKPNMRGYGDRTGVLVLVDGVRMNSPGDSTANALWAAIPPQDIDRIEIIRGGGSTIYGEGAIGGVINIITNTMRRSRLPTSTRRPAISVTGAATPMVARLGAPAAFTAPPLTNKPTARVTSALSTRKPPKATPA